MKTNNFTLMPDIQFGTQTDNYDGSSQDFTGSATKASGYYSRYAKLMTIAWHLSEFIGTVLIEATLDADAETGKYFTLTELASTETILIEDS